jgi:threonyl-tRNA synthetase
MPKILGFEFQLTLGLSTAKGVRRRQGGNAKKMNGGNAKNMNSGRILQETLDKSGLDYAVEKDYRSGSEAWIEVTLADALGRLWSGPFITVPMNTQAPTLVCSLFGTMERLVGLLLERYAGNLPLWIAPEQVRLIPLSGDAHLYADRVQRTLKNEGIRSVIDVQNSEPGRELGSRLYQAIVEKIPYAVIMGDREIQAENLVVRTLGSQQEERMNVDALCKCIRGKIPS